MLKIFHTRTVSRRLIAVCFGALVAACNQQPPAHVEAVGGQKILRGLGGEPASLDPGFATDSFSSQVLSDLYEGLTSETATGQITPGVAASWTVDETGKEYTFQIRPNAKWSNGRAVRAQDFVFAWQRMVDPKRGSPVANDLRVVSKAEAVITGRLPTSELEAYAVSDSVLVVRLEHPAPYFPQLLSHSSTFPIFSETAATSHDQRSWVSNGPYVLSSWHPGTRIDLDANPEYWNSSNVPIVHVAYLMESDPNTQFAAYRSGQIDITDTIPPNAISKLRDQHANELRIAPYLATAFYGLNLASPQLNKNPTVRKALAMAIDRKELVKSLSLGQTEAYGIVPPGTWNYSPQFFSWCKWTDSDRLREAKRLLLQSGYTANNPLRLRLLFNSNAGIGQTAVLVAAMWKQGLGVETELINEEFRVFLQTRRDKKKWDVLRLAWNADFNDATAFLEVFRSKSSNNDSGYSNRSFDRLLDIADETSNPESRKLILELAEQVLLNDYPVIPLYFLVSKRLVKPYVFGATANPFDRIPSKELSMMNTKPKESLVID